MVKNEVNDYALCRIASFQELIVPWRRHVASVNRSDDAGRCSRAILWLVPLVVEIAKDELEQILQRYQAVGAQPGVGGRGDHEGQLGSLVLHPPDRLDDRELLR